MVAGGIGQTPFLALGQEDLGPPPIRRSAAQMPPAKKVTLCYGVRTADLAAGVDDFRAAGVDVRLASDDGTVGHHGLVTELLQDAARRNRRRRSPRRLLRPRADDGSRRRAVPRRRVPAATSRSKRRWPAASASASAASPKSARRDGGWDYKRTCVEGPIFDAEKIEW